MQFLVVIRLYKRMCPSVGPSIGPSVRNAFFFGRPKMREIEQEAAKGVSEPVRNVRKFEFHYAGHLN